MSTGFVTFQAPPGDLLSEWDRAKFADQQPKSDTFPPAFVEAMSVREDVFVKEQKCQLEIELDDDDARSWHWVAYVSIGATAPSATAKRGSAGGKLPAATVRLVPPPHAPHPNHDVHDGHPVSVVKSSVPTSDDEPYVKIGRVATLKAFRKLGLARLLIDQALLWASEHAEEILPPPSAAGREAARLEAGEDERDALTREWEKEKWTGLVLVHAQTYLEAWYGKLGFVKDARLGEWEEAGIQHIGMWKRIAVKSKRNSAIATH